MMITMKIVGMLPVFNDEDIIQEVIEHLLSQGINLVVLDNGSTDKTYEICKKFVGKGVLQLNQYKSDHYDWSTILRMLYDMALRESPDWVLRSDSDEFLESGMKNITLKQAIEKVESKGYNLIQFDTFDFFMTDDDNNNAKSVRKRLRYYSWTADFDYRAWKVVPGIRVEDAGGHYPIFPQEVKYRIYPKKFVERHYKFRSQSQWEKNLKDRLPRIKDTAESKIGWHDHYKKIMKYDNALIVDSKNLTRYNEDGKWNLEGKIYPYYENDALTRQEIFNDKGELRNKHWTIPEFYSQIDERTKWALELNKSNEEKDKTIFNLQKELDERTKWAHELNKSNEEKDKIIANLQKEFDERTKWALELNKSNEEKDKIIANLQREPAKEESQLKEQIKNSDKPFEELTEDEITSRLGLWDARYRTYDGDRIVYDDPSSAKIAGGWLNIPSILKIEDWGGGYGGFKNFIGDHQKYICIDGSKSKFTDKIEDLTSYTSNVDAIHIRHVLEHNPEWQKILSNFLSSFKKRGVLTLFTPFSDKTTIIAKDPNFDGTGVDMVDISFSLSDLNNYFSRFKVKVAASILNIKTDTEYKVEHIFLLEK